MASQREIEAAKFAVPYTTAELENEVIEWEPARMLATTHLVDKLRRLLYLEAGGFNDTFAEEMNQLRRDTVEKR